MTNAQIIMNNAIELLKEGKIRGTGRFLEIRYEDGRVERIPEPEPIHTYSTWKSLGFQVKRGEHAVAKFTIWKYATSRRAQENENEEAQPEQENGRCFMKLAHFFSLEQVEPICAAESKTA